MWSIIGVATYKQSINNGKSCLDGVLKSQFWGGRASLNRWGVLKEESSINGGFSRQKMVRGDKDGF